MKIQLLGFIPTVILFVLIIKEMVDDRYFAKKVFVQIGVSISLILIFGGLAWGITAFIK